MTSRLRLCSVRIFFFHRVARNQLIARYYFRLADAAHPSVAREVDAMNAIANFGPQAQILLRADPRLKFEARHSPDTSSLQ